MSVGDSFQVDFGGKRCDEAEISEETRFSSKEGKGIQ